MTPVWSQAPPLVRLLRPLGSSNTLFLDRDGVLNEVVMREEEVSSPRDRGEFRICEDLVALAAPELQSWNLVVVTNQPDLSRGLIDEALLDDFHNSLAERIPINAFYICPHLSTYGCGCRKPARGLIDRFRQDHPVGGFEIFIGDRESDQQCARNAQIPFALRKRSYNSGLEASSDLTLDTLWAVESVLSGPYAGAEEIQR